MRTTLSLDDDVFQLIRSYAEGRSQSLGKAVSELVKRGLDSQQDATTIKIVNGLPVVVLPEDSPVITSEHVKRIEAESE